MIRLLSPRNFIFNDDKRRCCETSDPSTSVTWEKKIGVWIGVAACSRLQPMGHMGTQGRGGVTVGSGWRPG